MNKITKAIITIFGAVNVVFNITIPFIIGFLVLNYPGVSVRNGIIVMIVATISSMYRAIEIAYQLKRIS